MEKEKLFDAAKKAADIAKDKGGKAIDAAKVAGGKAKDVTLETKDKVMQAMDQNGDGEITIEDIIIMGLKTPGVKIDRKNFLTKEFGRYYSQDIIDDIVKYNPAHANVKDENIEKIVDEVIKYERNCVSGISTALGMPGGVTMVATIPADIAQYYGYMLRAMQKLMYLYGFPEIDLSEKNQLFDSETINTITLCLGVMYGVAGANNALKVMAKGLATGVEKKIMNTAITKGVFYPMVKKVAKWFGVNMTKKAFAEFFSKAIPLVGGAIGGAITFASFKPCCDRLKETLKDTFLSNPNHVETPEEVEIVISGEEITENDLD